MDADGRILEIINNNELELFGSKDIKISNASITVKNLSFKYGEKEVLSNIGFNIHQNSATALIGVSGSGKSTLFGIMSKLLSVGNNKVFIDKFDINDFTEKA